MSNQAPRIAIKFGASSSSSKPINGSKGQTRAQPSSTLGKRHRAQPHNHTFDSHSDSESDQETRGRHEAITTFGGESSDSDNSEVKRQKLGTDKPKRGAVPYVISGHKDRDWKKELKAQTQARGSKQVQPSDLKETVPADQNGQIKWGLNTTKKPVSIDAEQTDDGHTKREKPTSSDSEETPQTESPRVSPSDDKDAMDALLGKRKSAKNLVIEGTSARNTPETPSELDVYRRRMEEAAEVSTVEEYDQIPEGEFGAAMLRGMGWNGEQRGTKPKEVEKRPNLLGLGAKVDEEIRKGELAQKHGHRERKPRLDEYRRDKEKERRDRESRHGSSYKSERERERRDRNHNDSTYSRHDRDRASYRYSDRGSRR